MEDKANNYEAAAQHYMTAAHWLMQAMKCQYSTIIDRPCRTILVLDRAMNPQMKQTVRPKIESYVKRAEEIKNILKNGAPKKKAVADGANGRGGSKDNKGDDDESGDPDRRRMMQKFEGERGRVRMRCPTRNVYD